MAVNAFRKLPSEDRVIALSRVQARRDASGLPDIDLGSIEGLRELIVEARRVSNER